MNLLVPIIIVGTHCIQGQGLTGHEHHQQLPSWIWEPPQETHAWTDHSSSCALPLLTCALVDSVVLAAVMTLGYSLLGLQHGLNH